MRGSSHAIAFAAFGLIVLGLSLDAIARVSTDIGCTRYRECDVGVLPDVTALVSQFAVSLALLLGLLVVANGSQRLAHVVARRRRP